MADAGAVVREPVETLGLVVDIQFLGSKHEASRAWHHIPRIGDWVSVDEVDGRVEGVIWDDEGIILEVAER